MCSFPTAHKQLTEGFLHCNELRHTPLWIRHKEIERLGEDCLPVLDTYGCVGNTETVGRKLRFRGGEDFAAVFNMLCESTFDKQSSSDRSLNFVVGKKGLAAIYRIGNSAVSTPQHNVTGEHMAAVLDPEGSMLSSDGLFDFMYPRSGSNQSWLQNLRACAAVAKIYSYLPHATISTLVFSQPLAEGSWCQALKTEKEAALPLRPLRLSLPEVFSCIALFDSGIYNVPADNLSHVFAVSTGNSIYVTSALLEDPHRQPNLSDVRRVPGNIGQAGVSFLVGPEIPKTRAINLDNWRLVNHTAFEGNLEDNFHQTSIHLSFTGYNMPMQTERRNRHIIDRPARLVEALVSVHDRGLWVAELDLVETLTFTKTNGPEADWRSRDYDADNYVDEDSDDEEPTNGKLSPNPFDLTIPGLHRLVCICQSGDKTVCEANSFTAMSAKLQEMKITDRFSTFTSIDNWDELLDFPQSSVLVVRTHKNWLARLAVTGVLWNSKGFLVVLLPEEPCWVCCGKF